MNPSTVAAHRAVRDMNQVEVPANSVPTLARQKGGHMVDCGCKEDGGKVEMNRGGKTIQDGNYEVTVNAPGDTTRTFYNKYNRQVMQTYPDGTIRYSTLSNNGNDDFQVNSWVGNPSFLRRLWFGNKQATPEKINA